MKTINQIRADFPLLSQEVNGKPLVYLDNGATTQKPQQVIDAISKYYKFENSNIHRGVHTLSQEATDAYEQARVKIQHFLNAKYSHEIIFTSGTTGGINMIASSLRTSIKSNDEIIITAMEHHSNIVPWQMLCEETGAILKVIAINKKGELLFDLGFKELFPFKDGRAKVKTETGKFGIIDTTGKLIIDTIFQEIDYKIYRS